MSKLLDDLHGRYVSVDENPGYDQEVAGIAPDKQKICILCGKKFIKNRRAVHCPRQHYTMCVNCGNRINITDGHFRGGFVPKTCCKACADTIGAQTLKVNCLEKYGVTNPMYVPEFADKAYANAYPGQDISMRNAKEVRTCKICGKSFTVLWRDPKQCCSVNCASALRAQHINEQTKICKLCGKPFTSGFSKSLYCPGPHYRNCVICGKAFLLASPDSIAQTCSVNCRMLMTHATNLQKYGVEVTSQAEVVREKLSQAYIKNHPTEIKAAKEFNQKTCALCGKLFVPRTNAQRVCSDVHYRNCVVCGKPFVIKRPSDTRSCCSKSCTVKKRESTTKARYGVAHALQSPELLKKAQQTTFEHYGVKYAMQSEIVSQKVSQAFLGKYGVPTPFLMEDFNEKAKQTLVAKYGKDHTITTTISKTNMEIAQLIERASGYHCELDKVKLDRYSYDIHPIGTNILFEIDPTYTHNVIGNHWHHSGLPADYHIAKTNVALANGYRCIHIFDWDDLDKITKLISAKQMAYARKCEVRQVSSDVANAFETINHLQGSCRGQSVRLGLYYDDTLVQLMTFGKPRYNKNYQWELLRLCTSAELRIVGGAERLFSYFIKKYSPVSIISYCDLAKFTGDVYLRLGFTLKNVTKPNKIWSKRKKMITNNLLNARGYDQLFGAAYGKGTSNEDLMLEHGWLPVYDCGQAVYEWSPKI